MRTVFVGAVRFSGHCLEEVLKLGCDVVGVITLDEKRAALHSDYARLSDVAARYEVPTYYVEDINAAESVAAIASLEPEVIFVFGWSHIIGPAILNMPRLGCIGSHPALLPRNRGRHPIIWALIEGLRESGLTFFYLDEGADSGDILWQRAFPIDIRDDAETVYRKVEALAIEGIREILPQLQDGSAPRVSQDHSKATYWPRRRVSDGEIHWEGPATVAYNLVRALARPYVGAHSYLDGDKLTVWKAQLPSSALPSEAVGLVPGTVIARRGEECDVRTGDGLLVINEYRLESGRSLQAGQRLAAQG